MTTWAIVAAAGEGSRLGGGPKAFTPVGGSPMLSYSLVAFAKAGVDGIVVAVPPGLEGRTTDLAAETVPAARVEVVAGGASRQESVRRALAAIPDDAERIVVHDAARPLLTVELIDAALDGLDASAGAVVALPLSDTVKRAPDGVVEATVPRDDLFRAQTPQAFRAPALRAAHGRAAAEGFEATDDAALLEWAGERVVIVGGNERNRKITTPEDLAWAETMLPEGG